MPRPEPLSRSPIVGGAILAVALVVGGWLIYEIHRTIGLGAPRFWTLLRDDRVFDLAMLDFALTAGWTFLVMIERTRRKDWRFWLSSAIFLVVPSVGIALFVVLRADGERVPSLGPPASAPEP